MSVVESFGKLVVISREGEESDSLNLANASTSIGRDKDCDLRIKLNSVSRKHANIVMDENMQYKLYHLSQTNPTLVNGEVVKEFVTLKNEDKISFGERSFVFYLNNAQSHETKKSTATPGKASKRHIPNLESIDENKSINFSKILTSSENIIPVTESTNNNNDVPSVLSISSNTDISNINKVNVDTEDDFCGSIPMQVIAAPNKKISTPLKKAIQERQKQQDIESVEAEVVAETKKTIITPLKQAINNRRKSYSQPTEETIVAAVPVPVVEAKKGINTPLKQAINAKRQSYGASLEPAVKQQIPEIVSTEAKKSINTLLKQAINAKRKSYGASSDKSEEATEAKTGINTPLKQAINARRQSLSQASAIEEVSTESRRPVVNTLLQQAIHARRKSYGLPLPPQEEEVVEELSKKSIHTPLRQAINARRQSFNQPPPPPLRSETKTETVPVVEVKKSINTPLKQAINAKRKSYSSSTSKQPANEEKSEIVVDVKKSINTPLKQAINAKRQSYSNIKVETNNDSVEEEDSSESMHEFEAQEILAMVENPLTMTAATTEELPMKTISTASMPYLDREYAYCDRIARSMGKRRQRQALRKNDSGVSKPVIRKKLRQNQTKAIRDMDDMSIRGTALQISIHALTNELSSHQGVSEETAYSMALNSLLPDLSLSISNNEEKEKELLTCLQDKGFEAYTHSSRMQTEPYAELVDQLSSSELLLINEFSVQLESLGMQQEEAYATALDAYVRGIERCYSNEETVASIPIEQTNEKEVDEEVYNLRDLFKLPVEFSDANSDAYDLELVETYADEIYQNSCVDPAIAYGISLDSFLADPVQFRHMVGKLALPCDTRAIRQTEEEDLGEVVDDVVLESNDSKVELPVEDLPAVIRSLKTPLKQAIHAKRQNFSATKTVASVEVKKGINTPLKLAINSNRQSYSAAKQPVQEDKPENVLDVKRTINTPLKQAINAKRQSFSTSKHPVSSTVPIVEVKKGINTPLKQAINAKRQSYSTSKKQLVSTSIPPVNTEAVDAKKSLKTPIKQAINSRRQSYSTSSKSIPVVESKISLQTPLKQAIHARRQSLTTQVEPASMSVTVTVTMASSSSPAVKRIQKRKRSLSSERHESEEVFGHVSPVSKKTKLNTTPFKTSEEEQFEEEEDGEFEEDDVCEEDCEVVEEEDCEEEVKQETEDMSIKEQLPQEETIVKECEEPTTIVVPDEPVVDVVSETQISEELSIKATEEEVKEVLKSSCSASKRGRKRSSIEVPIEETGKQAAVTPAKRGRKKIETTGPAETITNPEPVVVVPVTESVVVVPSAKRGRKKATEVVEPAETTVVEVEEVVVPEPEPVVVVAPVKRGGRKKADVDVEVEVEAVVPVVMDEKVVEVVPVKKGRKKVEVEVESIVPVIVEEPVSVPTKRDRKKVEVEEPEVLVVEQPQRVSRQTAKTVANAVPVAAPPKGKGKKNNKQELVEEEDEEALVIICDKCEQEFFCDEIGLTVIPDGDWFCTGCIKTKPKAVTGTNKRRGK